MERLLHYCWQNRILPAAPLHTTDGRELEVISPGVHNSDAGPDFLGSIVKIGGVEMAGNVEIHTRSSDWNRHGHGTDPKYANIVLHVVERADVEVEDCRGTRLPQMEMSVPAYVEENYAELQSEERFPPCYRNAANLPAAKADSWLDALHVERLESKTERISDCLARCEGDWEQVCFITLARNFGFGINSDAFEEWAYNVPLHAAAKHRDNILQIEALFLGQAGLLDPESISPKYRAQAEQDEAYALMRREYAFLAHKFTLTPMPAERWKLLRTRPQNFPHIRLSQLASLYCRGAISLAALIAPGELKDVRRRLETGVTDYWKNHYTFGHEGKTSEKRLQLRSLNLIVLNSVVPLLFAYGRYRGDDEMQQQALRLYSSIPPEDNAITRTWLELGVKARSAADSQAMIHLKKNYCDRRDCLRCRFGHEYLAMKRSGR